MFRYKYVLVVVAGILLFFNFSCSRKVYKEGAGDNIRLYPPPPEQPRIQFLLPVTSSLDITGKRSGFGKFLLGEKEKQNIMKPYGVAASKGKLYITDTGTGGIDIIDLEKGEFSYFLPEGRGELIQPLNCYADDSGSLYVADLKRKQVVVFNKEGNYVKALGEGLDFKPTDVSVRDGKIWVVDMKGQRVVVYDQKSYKKLYVLPDYEQGSAESLFSPTNIFVSDDKVYVSDFGDFKIKVYTHKGEYIMSVGSYGDQIGQFVRPKGIAADREENLYVVDAGFENTQIFNKEGKLLMFFGGPYQKPGDLWLPAKVTIDYENTAYFEKYVDKEFSLKYLIYVTSQFGPDKLNVYGFIEPKEE